MSISQLDLMLLGGRAITSRVGAVEGLLRQQATASYGDVTFTEPVETRANLLLNSSFEYLQRGLSHPENWSLSNATTSTGSSGADGLVTLIITPGGFAVQNVGSGLSIGPGSFALSVNAKTTTVGVRIYLAVSHSSIALGSVYRMSPDGVVEASNEVPPDGRWYRFYLQGRFTGAAPAQVLIGNLNTSSGTLEVDAAKFEYDTGATGFIAPTAYRSEDFGASLLLRNLRADNIRAGTLTVGGVGPDAPFIVVLDSNGDQLVSIGEQSKGIEVVGAGGVAVTGSGSLIAGTAGGQRVEIAATGISGYNSNNAEQIRIDSDNGRLRVLGPGAVSVEGGGSLIAGTPGAARVELTSGGIFAYNANNAQKIALSADDGTLTIDADALIVEGTAVFDAITVEGAVTILQDLTLGPNVLFVDTSGQRVGINQAPDPQFDLDVRGSIRAGGYFVGKHALQLADALLIAHYDGSNKAGDTTGDPTGHRGQYASITGTVSYVSGKFNKAVDTTLGYLSYASNGNILASEGTLMLWVKPTTTSGQRYLFTYGSPTTNGFLLRQNGSSIDIEWYDGVTTHTYSTPSSTLEDGSWSHIAVSWGSNTMRLYVDGELIIEQVGGFTAPQPNATITVGGRPGGGFSNWAGLIDDLVILGTTADAALVRAVYESDAPVFAETSSWGFRTPNTLAWADEEGLWARDASGNEAFGVSGVNGKSWGNIGTPLDSGDVLIGNTTNYVFWDSSNSALKMRGTLEGPSVIKLGDDDVVIDQASIRIKAAASAANSTSNSVRWIKSGSDIGNIHVFSQTGLGEEMWVRTSPTGTGHSRIALVAAANPSLPGRTSGTIQIDANLADNTSRIFIGASDVRISQGYLHVGNNSTFESYLAMWSPSSPRYALKAVANDWLRLNEAPNGSASFSAGVYTPGVFRADGDGRFGAGGATRIGTSGSYSALWRGDSPTSYVLQWKEDHTLINSRGGSFISFRDNNVERARIDSSGLTVTVGGGSFSGGVSTSGNITASGTLTVNNGANITGNLTVASGRSNLGNYATVGNQANNYWPDTTTWTSGGATVLLNGLDYTSIAFHDASNRVDAIVAGGGWIRIGQNIGWGNASVLIPGALQTNGNCSFLTGHAGFGTAATANQRVRIASTGNDGNHYPLIVSNTAGDTALFYIRNASSTTATGYLAAASWSYSSDITLKENVETETDGIEKLRQLRPIRFNYIGDTKRSRGFSAQELREVFPDLVEEIEMVTGQDEETGRSVVETKLAVRTGELIPVLLRGLLQLDEMISGLKERLDALERRFTQLEAKRA